MFAYKYIETGRAPERVPVVPTVRTTNWVFGGGISIDVDGTMVCLSYADLYECMYTFLQHHKRGKYGPVELVIESVDPLKKAGL